MSIKKIQDQLGITPEDLTQILDNYYTKAAADGIFATKADTYIRAELYTQTEVDALIVQQSDFGVQAIAHTGGDLTIDFTAGKVAVVTLQADIDLLSFVNENFEAKVILIQDTIGGHNILNYGSVLTPDGVSPDISLEANAQTFFNVINLNSSTYIFSAASLQTIGSS